MKFILPFLLVFFLSHSTFSQIINESGGTNNADNTGSMSYTANNEDIMIECWGGGGGTVTNAGSVNGGGGGAYSFISFPAVTGMVTFNYTAAGGTTNGGAGRTSTITVSGAVSATLTCGGGGNRVDGGGGGAGKDAPGNNGMDAVGGTGGDGGAGIASNTTSNKGKGGDGGDDGMQNSASGTNDGGGGGGKATNSTGQVRKGARGKVVVRVAAVLPVELMAFVAQKQGKAIQLSWTTASELNNSHFEIEHSLDGQHFTYLDKVIGMGTYDEQMHYQFTDKEVYNGTHYYRLRQVDFDGAFEYSKTVSVDMGGVVVFPNPVKEQCLVKNLPSIDVIVKVFNATGQVVYQKEQEAGDELLVDTSRLPKGYYILSIVNALTRETIHHEQLVKK